MGNTTLPGIFCIESDWVISMESKQSVEPALQALERAGYIRLIRRSANTAAELELYLDRWFEYRLRSFTLAYLGFHGTARTLHLRDQELNLPHLAGLIHGRAEGKVLHFGSCRAMAGDEQELQQFCRATGAAAITGYTKNIEWLESSAFELLLLPELMDAVRMKSAHDRIVRRYPDLAERLGFRMSHATWTSP
ncbi:DUF6642 family protein [Millisia brevis]|uniref:DUF6642 family protein n=1 Tax=Millisia brevis TaxID=264148 RepID=UPI00082A4347|nr:DUF6642 family protein [Millisia brevis]